MSLTTPRRLRLPMYLADVPVWVDMADSIDTIFQPVVDDYINKLSDSLSVTQYHPTNLANKIANAEILDSTDWIYNNQRWIPENLRVNAVTLLGFNYVNTGFLDDNAVEQVARTGASFLPFQGTPEFISFIGFALGINMQLINLWTYDYIHFIAESAIVSGTEIYNGGIYYPTTHVDINIFQDTSNTVQFILLLEILFFYFPINIVIRLINYIFNIKFTLNMGMIGQSTIEWGKFKELTDTIDGISMTGTTTIVWGVV